MNNPRIDENEVLRDALAGLNEEVPPMPEGLHAAWMQRLENSQRPVAGSEKPRTEKLFTRKSFTRFLSVAAAAVFIIGGTALTRDDLNTATMNSAAQRVQTLDVKGAREPVEEEFALAEAYDDSWAVEDGAFTMTTMTAKARGVSNDAAAAVPAEKKIIRSASMTIVTKDYDAALENLRALCLAEGGWVEHSSESTSNSTQLRTAWLTLRIPQEALDGYLAGSQQLGRVTSQSESATDVTASYQDTQARLDTQMALMDRLKALITESADLSDLLALESQMADTQYTIDALQSSLNATDRQVSYSTVDITLKEEDEPALTDTTVSLGDRIAAALRTGWDALTGFVGDAAVFLVAALPFIGIVAVLIIGVNIWRKIKRRNSK